MRRKLLCFTLFFIFSMSTYLSAQEKSSSIKDEITFTGAVREIQGADLERVSTTNILNALSILDPSFVLMFDNNNGSNPVISANAQIRSVKFSMVESPKIPLVIIDGIESDLQTLSNLSVFDIDVIRIYKDAMSIYAGRAANGVIEVKRKVPKDGKINASYHFVGELDFADISSYEVTEQKDIYDYTNWIKKPLRTAFSHTHYLNVSGKASGLAYQLTANYDGNNGVMKDDYRKNSGVGLYLSYNLKDKFIVTARGNYNNNSLNETPYGDFNHYVNISTSESPYDEKGEYKPILSDGKLNPLYEASLSSFSKAKSDDYSASLDLKWNILKNLSINGFGYVTGAEMEHNVYNSSKSGMFIDIEPTKKGSYNRIANDITNYFFRLNASYLINFNERNDIALRINAGGEMNNNKISNYSYQIYGFSDHDLDKLDLLSLEGIDYKDKIMSFTSSVNFKLRNTYLDGSYYISNPTRFNETDKNLSFWNIGAGWRINNESWFKGELFSQLNLRASYGSVGSLLNRFSTYGVMDFSTEPVTKWNIGLTASLKKFLTIDMNYYNEYFDDFILIQLPNNSFKQLIEQKNNGFEFSISSNIIDREVSWKLALNALFNKNKIININTNTDESEMSSIPKTTPNCIGALSSYFSYKNFSLDISMQYSLGAEIYNTSLVERKDVERIYSDRWESANQTSTKRFVEKADYLNLSYINLGYKFSNDKLNKVGLNQLNFGLSLNNIAHFTSTNRERGVYYPFARGFSIRVGAIF